MGADSVGGAAALTHTSSSTSLASSGFSEFGTYNQDTCCICLEKYCSVNPAMTYACGHAFHLQCAEAWRERGGGCPMCLGPMVEAELYTGGEEPPPTSEPPPAAVAPTLPAPRIAPSPSAPDAGASSDGDGAAEHAVETDALLSPASAASAGSPGLPLPQLERDDGCDAADDVPAGVEQEPRGWLRGLFSCSLRCIRPRAA
eukprot:TRINITY_DN2573_c0_g1_i1.p2 TRINITY_DN2573_c0_g1~~TRINITY_DN2573_c0_g1_i1.p2  ORF type:complete len:201 (+),score=25.41 TRINITY_DN2573_c0_g1_i1:63-665(+)